MRKLLFLSLAFAALCGCSEPTIDTSSSEATQTSITKVRESLPEPQRKEFDAALAQIAMSNLDIKGLLAGTQTAEGVAKNSMASLSGKTGAQVIAAANALIEERKAKERAQAAAEIEELKAKQTKANAAEAELAKFAVSRSRFYLRDSVMGKVPVIELTVTNNTTHPIARAYFKGTIASPGRAVPWHSDTFNYEIPGGLEPGETANWSLQPNMFSDWGKVKAPADAVFTVEVEQLDGADGEELFSSRNFDEDDAKRLSALLKEHG